MILYGLADLRGEFLRFLETSEVVYVGQSIMHYRAVKYSNRTVTFIHSPDRLIQNVTFGGEHAPRPPCVCNRKFGNLPEIAILDSASYLYKQDYNKLPNH